MTSQLLIPQTLPGSHGEHELQERKVTRPAKNLSHSKLE